MRFLWLIFLPVWLAAAAARAADAPLWRTNQAGVEVDIKDWDLTRLLKNLAATTGWHVYMEKGTTATITAKFKDVSVNEALTRLLSRVNFSRSSSNGVGQLFVYRTEAGAATEAVQPSAVEVVKDYRIPNELVVRLKKDSKETIEVLAKALRAKIVERDDNLKLYRLQFEDEASANAASILLNSDTQVAGVDSNYMVDPPAPAQVTPLPGLAAPPSLLNPKAPVGGMVVGLVDTAVQMQSQFQPYSQNPLSVVGQPDPSADQITHGTSMFETMVMNMGNDAGKIQPVDVYPSGESTTTYHVVEGIIAAVNAGDNPINLSLGGTGNSALLQQVIAEGTAKGILFVAASGNMGGTGLTYPASYPGVLAVTASDPATGQLASYANDGSFVRAMEPGTSIVWLNGQAWQVEGTSTATALATSTIAQMVNEQHITLAQAVAQFVQSHPPPHQ